MKKISKILMITLILVVAIAPMTSLLFADTVTNNGSSSGVGTSFPTSITPAPDSGFMAILNTGWGLVLSICQIAAFGIIIFCGLKYMFASASEKADIKKSIGPLLIGAILVFGSTFIVTIVMAIVDTLQ